MIKLPLGRLNNDLLKLIQGDIKFLDGLMSNDFNASFIHLIYSVKSMDEAYIYLIDINAIRPICFSHVRSDARDVYFSSRDRGHMESAFYGGENTEVDGTIRVIFPYPTLNGDRADELCIFLDSPEWSYTSHNYYSHTQKEYMYMDYIRTLLMYIGQLSRTYCMHYQSGFWKYVKDEEYRMAVDYSITWLGNAVRKLIKEYPDDQTTFR